MLKRSNKSVLKLSEIERICWNNFYVKVKISAVLVNNAMTGNRSNTTVFQNDRNEIFALCTCEDSLTLADVKNIIKLMGMKHEHFYPPNADEDYFYNYAKISLESVFPGRRQFSDQDASYYKSFAPYSPALVKISEIDGEIRNFDTSWNKWISATNFSYYRVKVK